MLKQKVKPLLEEQKNILVQQFSEETGCKVGDAVDYLSFANYDLELSMALFLLMQLKDTTKTQRKRSFNMGLGTKREIKQEEQQEQEQEQEQVQEQEEEQQFQMNEKEEILKKELSQEKGVVIHGYEDLRPEEIKKSKICAKRTKRKPFKIIKRHRRKVKTTKQLSMEELKFFINQKPCPSWEARLTAFRCYDTTLMKGFKNGKPSNETIEIEKCLFKLYLKLNNGKISSKNLQRGVITFLERKGYEKVDDRSRKTMLFHRTRSNKSVNH
ncbi:adp-ribosylation factor-like protein 13b [Anaeramoeba flamelloides]|uniref:Adp-ribosylation factor-like protein 13b n=1 Tax=Anaeramoeba flamelloides TaxID=1746091 RepID=A0AAV7YQX6_9EUKA|nr:adp-ribosylation factor-like protein 13b [Anaeramoeba flamelloides]